jgi:hypothetical protein
LVAQTPAEYRVLGTNEAVLAALRTAGGGSPVVTPLDPWRHDLTATDRFTELWPLLLVLALLLWPVDIALRRMSLGRREFAAARGWVRGIGLRRRATARRTATGESLLAARERAGSSEARTAILGGSAPALVAGPEAEPPATAPPPGAPSPAPPPGALSPAPPAPPPAGPPPRESPAVPAETLERLRDAKRRARER